MAADQTAEERILLAAVRCVAEHGLSVSLRTIAAAAGVSGGLIIHHYGSRQALLEACDAHALRVTRESKAEVIQGGAPEMLAQLAALEQYTPVIGYVLRRLQIGGRLAQEFLEDYVRMSVDYLQAGVEQGTITPSRDPEARARVLTEMGLGALVLQLPGQDDPLDLDGLPDWLRRYTERIIPPVLEIYSVPLFPDTTFLDAYHAHQGTARPDTADDAHDDPGST